MEQTKHSVDANRQPFSVPEGYFDNLPLAVIQKIDDQNKSQVKRRRSVRRLRPIYIAAASLCAAVFGVAVYLGAGGRSSSSISSTIPRSTVATATAGADRDAVADYTMMDNEDIYTHYSEI